MGRSPGGIWYRCHRASCGLAGFKPEAGGERVHAPAPFEPRPYPGDLVAPGPENQIWDRLRVKNNLRGAAVAARIGLSARADDSDEVVWTARAFDWSARGHMSRRYRDKFIRTWRTAPGAWYGYFADRRTPWLWVVEDPVSAARIQLAGGSALCLFGTTLGTDLRMELRTYLDGQWQAARVKTRVLVALDPDASRLGADLAHLLTARTGYGTIHVPIVKDIKDHEPNELLNLMEFYQIP